MTDLVSISASGNVTICASDQCAVFKMPDPRLPANVVTLLSGILSDAAREGLSAVHGERRGTLQFTHISLEDGTVIATTSLPQNFDAAVALLDDVLAATPPITQPAEATIPDLSFAQLLIGLVTEEWITESEGGAWLVGTLPAPVLAVIATLPSNQQFAAKARAIRPSAVVRADPLVAALAAAEGKTTEELDAFFTTYAAT